VKGGEIADGLCIVEKKGQFPIRLQGFIGYVVRSGECKAAVDYKKLLVLGV